MNTPKMFWNLSSNKVRTISLAIILLAFFSLFSVVNSQSVSAAAPYLASDVLGQTDFMSNSRGTSSTKFYNDGLSPTLDSVNHRLFVTDSSNSRILVYNLDSSNNLIDKTADYVIGQPDFDSSDTGSYSNTLSYPGATAYDSVNNRLFVPDIYDNCRILVFDTTTITNGEDAVNIIGGSDINDYGDCGVSQSSVQYESAYGSVAYDETTQRLYLADTYYNNRIMVFDLSGGIADGMNASNVLGAPDFDTEGSGEATDSTFYDYYPNLVIDSKNQRLFFSSYYQARVLVFDVATITNGEPAVNVLGQPDFFTTEESKTVNGMGGPIGLGYDPVREHLFVADYTYGRIQVFDVSSITNGEDAIGVLGQEDLVSGDRGNTSQSGIYPYDQAGMAYDSLNHRLWYGDDANARVLSFEFVNITLADGETPAQVPEATFGKQYEYQLPINGAQGDISCELEEGELPLGVVITEDCRISGAPASNTVYQFVVRVTDNNGTAGSFYDLQSVSLKVNHADNTEAGRALLANTGDNSNNLQAIAVVMTAIASIAIITELKKLNSKNSSR